MRLVDNWKLLHRAWSVRFNAVSVFCMLIVGLEYFWPYLGSYLPFSAIWFGAVGALLTVAALIARPIFQENVSGGSDADRQD